MQFEPQLMLSCDENSNPSSAFNEILRPLARAGGFFHPTREFDKRRFGLWLNRFTLIDGCPQIGQA